ncbi:MAG TPA: FAD-dependent oxidoreductase [Burkholderiaceae bacterium]|nr:FAD-dependent oxidoreductase [Burkholderiaceae bacterium]
MSGVVILGSGMAGWGAAHRLHANGVSSVMLEKNGYIGGHAASHRFEGGWLFDEGPHVSFTKVDRIATMLAANIGDQYRRIPARVNNHWRGHWIKHPAQCNLYGLPADLVVGCIRDFVEAQKIPTEIRNYRDWLLAAYGTTFAETFPMEYTVKYHTTTADNMSTEWLGPRLYRPTLDEVLRGALSPKTGDVHYVDEFRYPTRGGFVAYLEAFRELSDLRLNHEVARIEPRRRSLQCINGVTVSYKSLISSLPLPELIRRIDSAPRDVREATENLACTTCVLVNLGVDRADLLDATWTYFYDRDIFMTRASTPHLQSPHNVPTDAGSLQAECYYSKKYRPLDRRPEECIEPVIEGFRRTGVLREDDTILFKHAMVIPYANVIFDLDRAAALDIVHGYLRDVGIEYCGRYGEWGYQWTDESFISGESAAQRVIESLATDAPKSYTGKASNA